MCYVLQAAGFAYGKGMKSYLCMMVERLLDWVWLT